MDLSVCAALSASWQAGFARNGCLRSLVPSFCDSALTRLAHHSGCQRETLNGQNKRHNATLRYPPRHALVCVACATRAPPWITLVPHLGAEKTPKTHNNRNTSCRRHWGNLTWPQMGEFEVATGANTPVVAPDTVRTVRLAFICGHWFRRRRLAVSNSHQHADAALPHTRVAPI